MEQQPTQTPFRRSPFEILGECFTIYGRHFRKFILIALIIQIPLAILEFAISDRLPSVEDFQALQVSIAGDPRANLPASAEYSLTEQSEVAEALSIDEIVGLMTALTVYFIAALLLQTFMAGVIVYAVGMQYVTGSIDVGRSYGRAWWRILTLVVLGLLTFAMILLLFVGFALLIVPGLIVLTLVIFWSGCRTSGSYRGIQAYRGAQAQLQAGAGRLVADIRGLDTDRAGSLWAGDCAGAAGNSDNPDR